jgi:hypothetical protein
MRDYQARKRFETRALVENKEQEHYEEDVTAPFGKFIASIRKATAELAVALKVDRDD